MTKTRKKVQRSRELYIQRAMARYLADLFANCIVEPLSYSLPDDGEERAKHVQRDLLICYLLANLKRFGSEFLRLIADAMEGELSPTLTDAVREAYVKACNSEKRKTELSFDEIRNALAVILTQKGFQVDAHKESVRRCLKILGYSLPKKRGRPRKSRRK